MGLTDLILSKGKVIVLLSASGNDIVATSWGKALNFGSVQRVYETSDKTTVGDSVMFDVNQSTPFTIISGNVFYLIDEKDILFTETIITPP